jgi:hypothetical protein
MGFLQKADSAFYEQVRDLHKFDPSIVHPHIQCGGCNEATGVIELDTARSAGATKATAASTANAAADGWESITKQAQPELSSKTMDAFFTEKTKVDNTKHQHEGMCRCFDDPHAILENLATKGDAPSIQLRSKVAQSQARGYYLPVIHATTDKSGAVIIKVTGSTCTCTKHDKNAICKHRAALLMFLFLNTAQGYAGSPTDRAAYWKDRGGKVLAEASNQVMRTIDVLTSRVGMPKMKELLEMEATSKKDQPTKRRRTRATTALASDSESDSDTEPAVTLEDAKEASENIALVGRYQSLSGRISDAINRHLPPLVGGGTDLRGAIADVNKAAAIVGLHKKYPFIKRLSRAADNNVTTKSLRRKPTTHPAHGVYNT